MKILQIASLSLPIRPDLKYGGTERVISYLDKVFTKNGHDSYVAATGDSKINGTLIPTIPKSLWAMNETVSITRSIVDKSEMMDIHYKKCIDFLLENLDIDVIHDHPGSGLVTAKEFRKVENKISAPLVVTLHGAFSEKFLERYQKYAEISKQNKKVFFNAISQSQKKEFENAGIRVKDVIYHGIPLDDFSIENKKSDYLFNLGRICPDKGQHFAIDIAKKSGRRLILAGEVHSTNEDYWKEMIEPHIDGDQIKFLGSMTDEEKIPFYQKAAGFIFPLQWQEPFGLVMIEAMACGTPIIAYSRGSVPEVVSDGKTGFVIQETGDKEKDLESMVKAVKNLDSISPETCRKHVEDKFSIEREADNYINLYQGLISHI